MSLRLPVILTVAALTLGACAPVTAYHGFQVVETNPKDVQVGVDNRTSVQERLGSPSMVASFEPDIWFYMSQVTDQTAFRRPVVKRRDIVAISFAANGSVEGVHTYALQDGRLINYSDRTTPTRGREMTALEQVLGTVGQQLLPQRDVDPGNPRGN